MEKAKVYFTEEITSESLQNIYHALGVKLSGKVAVKLSTGEPGGHNFLQPALIKALVSELNGTIVECNTAYEGRRNTTKEHWKAIREHAVKLTEKFDVRPRGSEGAPAGTLSGGNQQKVIIAREVTNDKELLIAVNPTRGLDVGAIEFVHKYIVEQRNRNRAVLLVSFELDEIMSLSDRIEVIFDGRITGSVPGKDADEKELGFMMAGGKQHE